ncbi:glycoside hydrolase family 13 protein [Romboutsia sp.]|uniref:glycoside hydrolase family 13 protein n=1 Tax=Romboutsia sp. TaxID=1965302 RepID=UPI003F332257
MTNICKEALLHIPKSNYAYGYDEETLHIRLRSKKNEVKNVNLRIGDPYIWETREVGGGNLNASGIGWSGGCFIEMKKELETEYFDYWKAEYKTKTKRSRYAFVIEGENEKLLYTEKGINILGKEDDEEKLCNIASFFGYSYLNNIDIPKVPEWVKNTIWYQIFPDRFANGNPNINQDNVEPWGSPPTNDNFTGGDLQGVINNLDYIKDLGITGIYFCPISEGHTNHRYDTIDYMKIDPHLGDEETLKTLVKEAHKRGIKIMLDAVFNHIGYYSKQWQDVMKNKEKSIYKDWFYIKDINKIDMTTELMDEKNIPYETFSCVPQMPKLNTENPQVIDYLIEVGKYWIEKYDIDAWRLDVSNEVDHSFWRLFRKEIKKVKPDVYILGEIWHNSLPWLMGDQFDAVMNYPLGDAILKFFCTNEIDATTFKYTINEIMVSYPQQISEVTFNLLGSHDTTRVLSLANGNQYKFKLAYLFMFIQGGCPCIYYGDEVGMVGVQTKDCEGQRECMVWENEKQDREQHSFIKKLIILRKEHNDFKSTLNQWFFADSDRGIVILKKENITIIINNNENKQKIEIPLYLLDKQVENLFTKEKIVLKESIELNSYGYLIVKPII